MIPEKLVARWPAAFFIERWVSTMKTCKCCGGSKPFEAFPVNRASRDGRYRLCCECNSAALRARNASETFKENRAAYLASNRERINAQARESYWRNPEAGAERAKRHREKNRDHLAAAAKAWRLANPEQVKANRDAWFAARPGYVNERGMRRYASKLRQTPAWADLAAIREVYALAAEFKAAGFDVHVDHIVPLKGKRVSGLHVQGNLRVCLAKHNREKSNTWRE